MSTAERSFRDSLRAFNASVGRASPTGGLGASASSFDLLGGQPSQSRGLFGGLFGRQSSSVSLGPDPEAQETLLGSFQTRSQSMLSSMGLVRNSDNDFCGLTTFQRYIGFAMVMGTAALCFMISLFTLPMVIVTPAKFALTFTFGSLLFLFSFSLLNGLVAHAKHIFSLDRVPFTASYIGSMLMTLFFAVVKPSYILVIFFFIVQLGCLAWYLGSYLPGGTQALRWMTRNTVGLPV